MKKEVGEHVLNAFLVEAVSDLVMFFNVGKSMNEQQLVQVVKLIAEKYYYLRPSELKYCFNQSKMGRYGKLYDRIDGGIIFDWLDKYLIERDEELYNANVRLQKETLKETSNVFEKLQELKIDYLPKDKEKENKNVFEIIQNETDKKIQKYFIEFDELDKKQNLSVGGKRFVNYGGKILDIEEFTKFKLNESKAK